MIILFCLCLMTLFSLCGYGILLDSLFHKISLSGSNKFGSSYNENKAFVLTSDYCLLGLFFVIFFSSLINLFFPLSNFSGIITLTAGILCVLYFIYRRITSFDFKQIALIVGCSIFCFLRIRSGFSFDTGLYRIPMLKWIEAHPIVFGLANLHGRFGFNSAWLMLHGALRLPFFEWNTLLISEVTIFILGLLIIMEGLFMRWHKLTKSIQLLLASILIIYLLQICSSGILVETTDNPANILGLLTVVYFLEFLGIQDHKIFQINRIYLIFISCALAVTIKLSMLPFLLLPIISLAITWKSVKITRELVIWFIIVITYFCLWLIRNIILSGCLLYPVSQTCFASLDWVVTVDQVINEKNAVLGWARYPGPGYQEFLNNYDWLNEWFKRMIRDRTVLLVLTGLLSAIILPIIRLIPNCRFNDFNNKTLNIIILFTKFLLPTTLTGILLWFFNGPDPRFAWSFLLLSITPFIAIWLQLLNFEKHLIIIKKSCNKNSLKAFCVALLVIILFITPQFKKPLLWTNTPVDRDKIVMKRLIDSEVLISVPQDTAQCWDIGIPCTPYYNPWLNFNYFWLYPSFQRHLVLKQDWQA